MKKKKAINQNVLRERRGGCRKKKGKKSMVALGRKAGKKKTAPRGKAIREVDASNV